MIGKPDDDDVIDWGDMKSPGSGITTGAACCDEAGGAQRPSQDSNNGQGGQGAYEIKEDAIVQASQAPALSNPPFSITASNGDNGRGLQYYRGETQEGQKLLWQARIVRLAHEILKADPEYHKGHLQFDDIASPLQAEIFAAIHSHSSMYAVYEPLPWMGEDEQWAGIRLAVEAAWEEFKAKERNELILVNGNGHVERALSIIIETDEAADRINAEYLARPEVIERLGYSQSIALIIGAKHHGKSTVTRSLALSVPRGLPVWGRRTSAGPVVYAASDDEVAATRAQLLEMGWRKGKDALYFVHINPTSDATAEQILEDIGNIAVQNKAAMIVLDMLFDFVGIKDELSYSETRTRIGQVQKLADITKCFVLGTHHTPKYLTEAHEAANAALGSQGVSARFSPIILVRKYADKLFTIESTPTRDPRGEALKATRLNRDDNGWISLGREFKEIDKWEIYAQRVLDVFEEHKGLSVSDVVQRLNIDRARAQNTLKQLETNGQLSREKLGHRYLYYRVVES